MKKIFTSFLMLWSVIYVNAQAPPLQAESSMGGSDVDHAFDIHQTRDGGYIMAGHTASNNGDVHGNHGVSTFDFWVVKLNKNGTIKWQKPLGGKIDETAFSVQ